MKTFEISLPTDDTIAVACSGGADSMALTMLAAEWCKRHGRSLIALTVDHGLRGDSASEADQVGRWLAAKGIEHTVLRWEGQKPQSNIQEAARKARYKLMASFLKGRGIKHLLVAHTLEDQAETFLLRLARGSGVDGLSCMSHESNLFGLTVHRPLLQTHKRDLISYLRTHKQPFINDPSNQNMAFDRIKIRKAMPVLEALGLTSNRLAATAKNMSRARAFLEEKANQHWHAQVQIFPEGYALYQPAKASEELNLRIMARLITEIGGDETKPRLADLTRLYEHISEPNFRGATLGGCRIIALAKGGMLACRELKALDSDVTADSRKWDRFKLSGNAPASWSVGTLTQEGWLNVSKQHGLKSRYPNKNIIYALPTLKDDAGAIRAVPHLGIKSAEIEWTAQFTSALADC